MEFSRQEYLCGLPFRSPGDLPNPGTDSGGGVVSVALTLPGLPSPLDSVQAEALSSSPSLRPDSSAGAALPFSWARPRAPGTSGGGGRKAWAGLPRPCFLPRGGRTGSWGSSRNPGSPHDFPPCPGCPRRRGRGAAGQTVVALWIREGMCCDVNVIPPKVFTQHNTEQQPTQMHLTSCNVTR